MELVKKKKKVKLGETRLGVVSFVCALLTLAYLNIFLLTSGGPDPFSNLFLQVVPTVGVLTGLISLIKVNHRRTFTWWALGLYGFMFVCILVIGFVEFATYTKP
ncbi:hypothetical protein [Halobacillus salinus]|uniref:Uncharacterized protein n=1 Tax=Halobacillus salinus TaxID=192814 RepID=A0A4Z0GTZ1_9BACI|nr:hypothetical protein [Halobacillus salinus]TGB01101.1 hypothetical protein E4663_18290 [Halobacillus salinus]